MRQSGNAPLRRLRPPLPVCGPRIMRRTLKRACILRPLRYREAVKTGAVSEGRSYAFYRRTGDNKRSDSRLPHEKQLSPPQAELGSVAPYRGGFQSSCPKAGELSANADGRVPCRINFVHTLAYRHKHFDNVPQKFRSRGLRPYLNFSFFRSSFQSFPIRSKTEVLP